MFKLPHFHGKSHASKTFLTIDIGSDYVKCLVIDRGDSSIPNAKLSIIGIGKQPLNYLSTRGGAIVDYESVKQALEIALSEAIASTVSNVKTNDVVVGLSGEMTKGLVTTVRINRVSPEIPITYDEFAKIVSKIQDAAYMEASKEIALVTGNPDLDIDITNSSISSVKIDDNFVNDPRGVIGQKLEVALFTAFSPSFHLKLLQKLVKDMKLNLLTITSEMYTLSKTLSLAERNFNAVLMDIGGETTDVGIVFGGGLVATRTLSLGGRHITRAISEGLGISLADAEDRKLRYSLNSLSEEDNLKIKEVIRETLDLWISGVELLFSDFDGVKTFPSKILLTGGGSLLKDVMDILEKEPWTRKIAFKELPVIQKIEMVDLPCIVDMTGKARTGDDVQPASIAEVLLEMERQS